MIKYKYFIIDTTNKRIVARLKTKEKAKIFLGLFEFTNNYLEKQERINYKILKIESNNKQVFDISSFVYSNFDIVKNFINLPKEIYIITKNKYRYYTLVCLNERQAKEKIKDIAKVENTSKEKYKYIGFQLLYLDNNKGVK